ncbi:PPC domain-containing protein [Gemmata sp. JC717]|uniref:PPC domain-containing protein n=1 Tax=Gemmata algarum TaxID=2975278 RepID=UPI0021BB9EF5|nr:PPC domain-containing protein [Gemmata algarum]MDY3553089.1 PPC domain-containing protein [Gemmata algarum]
MFARRLVATLALLFTAGPASAQPGPQLLTIFPTGAKAGSTTEVTFAGVGFDGDEKLLFSAKGFTAERVGVATTDPKAPKGAPAASVKFKVTAPKGFGGTCDVRVVSKSGLSNPRAFAVGSDTEVNEVEPNNDVPQAQKVELDTTVNGVVSAPTDVDFVTFKAKAGQNVAVYCLTTSIDSRMQAGLMVSDAEGRQLASNRNYRGGDAALDFKAPKDGDYTVRVSQFAYTTGGPDHFYRLTITTAPRAPATFPPVAEEGAGLASWPLAPSAAMVDLFEPPAREGTPQLVTANPIVTDTGTNLTAAEAQLVKVPCDIAGRIAKKGERHWYSFAAKKGDVWTLEVFAERIGSPVDAYFILTDEKGKVIVEQDDGADTLSPNQFYTKSDDPGRYRFAAPADGTYKVMVSTREAAVQFGPRDQYVLRIAKEKPDFRLAVMPLTPHVPDAATLTAGGAVALVVYAFRFDGFDGAIELGAEQLPREVKCPKQVIGPGQTRGVLVLTCEKPAADFDGFVTITGTAGSLKQTARPFSVTWPVQGQQANQPPPNSPVLTRMDRGPGLALAIRGTAPFVLTPTETSFKVKGGGKFDVTLKITRDTSFKEPVAIYVATPGFGPRPQGNQPFPVVGTAQPNSTEIKLNIDVPANLPPGTHTLVLRGQSGAPTPKINNSAPRPLPNFAVTPLTVTIEGVPKKK